MSKKNKNTKKDDPQATLPDGFYFRSAPVVLDGKRGVPASLDEENRSVEVICASENPVVEMDYERWERVPTILLMSGCQIPANKQVVLLDSHYRYWTETVLGSCRELRIEGDQLIGRAHYSEAEEAESPWLKTKEGHLTDYSVGRVDLEAHYIPDGEKQTIDGREFDGPIKVVTKWIPREMSVCPIGADEEAKARSATPAKPDSSQSTKENDMDEKLRKFLESRGLPTTATEDEAYRHLETFEVRNDDGIEEATTRAAKQEQERCIEVRSTCLRAGIAEDKISEFITGGTKIDKVRKDALDFMVENNDTTGGIGHRGSIELGKDERDKFRAAGEDSLLLRAGLLEDVDKAAPGAMDLRGYSMVELGRESLRMAGQNHRGDSMEMIGRALTTSDFPVLLGNTANLSLAAGWEEEEETWMKWADGSGSVSNFNIHTMARAGEADDLDEVKENDEYKYGDLDEAAEQYQVATFGKLNSISRQAIINDNMDAITTSFRNRGGSAARKVGDVAYAVLTANADMGDGNALFHATHGNLLTAGVISETTIGQAETKLGLQKDIGGKRRLNIPVRFVLAPITQKTSAEIFFASLQFSGDTKGSTRQNIYAGDKIQRVYDGRLDDISTTAWYALGPKGKTVKLFFLNGKKVPYLETRNGWNVDGVEYKTRIDVGGKAVDWRGMASNAGA